MKTFCSCFQAICWGRALRTRGVQWAPQGGAAGLFARGQRRRRLRLLWNTEPLTLRVKMSVGPGSDLNTVSLGCAASCNIDIRRSVRIPRKCQQEAFTVLDACKLFYILSGDLWNTGGTPMPWSYWPCRNCRQPKILRPHQKGNNTHGCCGYTVFTLRLLETPMCQLFTRPDTKKKVQPLCCKFNQWALRVHLSMVLCRFEGRILSQYVPTPS